MRPKDLIGWAVVLLLCTVHLPTAGFLAVGLACYALSKEDSDGRP